MKQSNWYIDLSDEVKAIEEYQDRLLKRLHIKSPDKLSKPLLEKLAKRSILTLNFAIEMKYEVELHHSQVSRKPLATIQDIL